MALDAKRHDPLTESQLNLKFGILLGRPQAQLFPRHRAQQVSLGKMRAFVRQRRLGSDQDDLAGESSVPESGSDGVSGRAAADDQRSGRVFSISRKLRSDQSRYPPSTTTAKAYAVAR
jgi:hypothetical protein